VRALALVAALAACGGGGETVRVCDDSADVRLAVRYRPGFALSPGEHVLYDHGQSWLYVDGRCDFHVKIGSRWDDARIGVADDGTLVDELSLGSLDELAGAYLGEVAEGATLEIAFDGALLTCNGGCTGAEVPEEIAELNAHAAALLRDLADRSTMPLLPQRVLVIAQPVPPTPSFLWPAALDPASIAVAPADADTAPSLLVTDDDGDALRDLRREVRDATPPPAGAWVTTDLANPPSFSVFLRDALPFEDADGQIANP
jgi:hypothetical protein